MRVTHGLRITKSMKFQKAAINNLSTKTNNKKNHWIHVTHNVRFTKNMTFQNRNK